MLISNLETKRLILRKAKISDLDDIYNNVWSDSRLNKYMRWKTTNTREDAIERLKKTIDFQKNNYAYFICEKKSNRVIGFIGIKKIKEPDVYAEIGTCIAKNYQRKGYGFESVTALMDLVFNKLNGSKFIYSFFENNLASKKLAIKLGLKYLNEEIVYREYDNKEFLKYNYYIDRILYGKVKNC